MDGFGYVFLEGDGLVGIDFDNCVADGKVHPAVENCLKFFPSYTELSPSGTGIHAICRGAIAKNLIPTPLPDAEGVTVEIYNHDRYLTFTGRGLSDTMDVIDCQTSIDKFIANVQPGGKHRKATGAVLQASDDKSDEACALTLGEIRRFYDGKLRDLRDAKEGEERGNTLLNNAAYFAGGAVAAKGLDKTFKQVETELLDIVLDEWSHPYPKGEAQSVIKAGWDSGFAKPLSVITVPDDPRQLTTAQEARAWFNERFFVVENYGNKCRVAWLDPDPNFENRLLLGHQSQGEFKSRFNHIEIKVQIGKKEISIPVAEVWLGYKWRQQYKEVIYAPGKLLDDSKKNLWQGFSVPARAGNCKPFLDFVREIICSGNDEHYQWVVNWLAYAVQHPSERGHTCLVLRGAKGTGKSFFADTFGRLWGAHYLSLVQPQHVVGRFNSHLRICSVLFANEAFFAGSHEAENILKPIITDETLTIEQKFVDAVQAPNYTHVILAGNADWLVRASSDERRFLMLDVSEKRQEDTEFFGRLDKHMRNHGGDQALLHYLLHLDLTGFEPRKAPHTQALRDQMTHSLDSMAEQAWLECLVSGRIPARSMRQDGSVELRASDFIAWARKHDSKWQIKENALGKLLGNDRRARRKPMGFVTERPVRNGPRIKIVPPLAECRALWDRVRFQQDWPRDSTQLEGEQWELGLGDVPGF